MEIQRCESCFKEFEGTVCPHCGGAQNDPHQLCVGTLLRDRYKLGRVLGQGGFGITYLGWDTLMQKPIAVKEFYPSGTVFRRTAVSTEVHCDDLAMEPHYDYSKERFLREASALVQFKDIPEIVDILDFVKDNNTAYIIMEYVRGVDLAKYIRLKGGRLSVDETFRILRPVMEALAKVHEGGIIHRDISPDNIILDPMGGAKLLDFGAVRAVEDPDVDKGLNKSTEAILKQGFAPIEQYNTRGSLGPWTDEYALCATVWYCLTGRVPEEASVRMSEDIDPDWSTIEGLPEHQQKALEKGFSRRAKDRYKSIDELLADLFPEETAQAAPEPAKEAPVERAAKKAKAPEKSGKKFWTVFTTAILALWLVLAVLIPKEIKTGSEEPVPQESAPAQIETQPTDPIETEPPTVALSPEQEAYALAETLLEEGKLGEAAIAFGKLAGYADARERSFEIWDMIAVRDTISAGKCNTVGLKNDGTVIAIGNQFSSNSVPGTSDTINGWTDVIAVSAGENHAIGLLENFTVIAIGENIDGQCNVSEWTDIISISAGYNHTVALRVDGTVVATGSNTAGQCDISEWKDIVAISAGGKHTVGLRLDGTVVVAGSNYDFSTWTNIVAISAGYGHIAGLRSDGTVITKDAYFSIAYVEEQDVSGWTNITAISVGADHTVGLREDGFVLATGWNYSGQCNVSYYSDIVAISAGYSHTVCLKADGTVIPVCYASEGQNDISRWTDIRLPYETVPYC